MVCAGTLLMEEVSAGTKDNGLFTIFMGIEIVKKQKQTFGK
jgi:hypothetical protein